jgi:putative nucleotidyltransferase with HDIG domain
MDFSASTNSEILSWAESQPWARAMNACAQDAQWHAEGDVWTHTRLVCAQLEQFPEWATLPRSAELKLFFAALFHDAGKPLTSAPDSETGRIRSPKHALAGAEIARRVLRELECNLSMREEIVSLVRYHGRPPYILEKENPEHEVISLSWLADTRFLYWLALGACRHPGTTHERDDQTGREPQPVENGC